MNASDISLNDPYSDSDDEIPIDQNQWQDYRQKLEEQNLFKMNDLQELQQRLEKQEKESRDKILTKREELNELDTNLEQLQASKNAKKASLSYYEGMLETNNAKGHGAAANATTSSGRSGFQAQKQAPKSTGVATRGQIQTTDKGGKTVSFPGGSRHKSLQQVAFDTHLSGLGAQKEEIKKINDTIDLLVKMAKVRQGQEDDADKLVLLKKVEIKLHELAVGREMFKFYDENPPIGEQKTNNLAI